MVIPPCCLRVGRAAKRGSRRQSAKDPGPTNPTCRRRCCCCCRCSVPKSRHPYPHLLLLLLLLVAGRQPPASSLRLLLLLLLLLLLCHCCCCCRCCCRRYSGCPLLQHGAGPLQHAVGGSLHSAAQHSAAHSTRPAWLRAAAQRASHCHSHSHSEWVGGDRQCFGRPSRLPALLLYGRT
jgi:hypothetical protein